MVSPSWTPPHIETWDDPSGEIMIFFSMFAVVYSCLHMFNPRRFQGDIMFSDKVILHWSRLNQWPLQVYVDVDVYMYVYIYTYQLEVVYHRTIFLLGHIPLHSP